MSICETSDFVVMSHRHGDHMGGLAYLLKVNPTVKIYAPKERSGVYGDDQPSSTWYRKDPSLPAEQRYYSGAPPEIISVCCPTHRRIGHPSTAMPEGSTTDNS